MRFRFGSWARRSLVCHSFVPLLVVAALVFIVGGCSDRESSPLAPAAGVAQASSDSYEAMAAEFVELCGWAANDLDSGDTGHAVPSPAGRCGLIEDFEREVLVGNIVHYSAVLHLGPGQYDKVGIHRVVRENRPNRPIKTRKALFMLHGDLKRFETMFIPGRFSPDLADDFGIAVFLAQHNVDVWGIDQGWNLVPREETDFSFFADWGIQREVDHLSAAIAVAREARFLTGNGLTQMLLLGYSSGCMTGYALLNQEAQMPDALRQVDGYIAADCGVRSDDPEWIENNLSYVEWYQSLYDSGQYQDALIFQDVSVLARTDPDGDSPFFPGMTNLQVALFFGGGQAYPPTDVHYHAPVLEDGFPVGFQWITVPQWLDFIENTAAYEPILFELEYLRLFAMQDSPYISHLGDITVPILDIGGAGGIAPSTAATVSYLGSSDITQLYVSTGAPEVALDYGHIDIFTGYNAPELVWQPLLHWVITHSNMPRHPAGLLEAEEIATAE